jgi:RHS repeat-associated protein
MSNPHGTSSSPSDGITTYQYDALDRKIGQTQQDGTSTQRWCYDGVASQTGEVNCTANLSGNITAASWVDSTDESGLHWQKVSDGLGRLRSVMESDGSTTVPKQPSMETDYTYDLLNNLTRVDQYGGPKVNSPYSDHVRTFTYDSLRLVTSSNPETGIICYGTWSGGAVGSGTCHNGYDANGNMLAKTDARNITKTYTPYDPLDRPTSYSYTDGTPGVSYTYDTPSEWSTTLKNPIGRLSLEMTSDGHSQSIFGYDAMGRAATRLVCTPTTCGSSSYDVSATYDLAGELTSYKNGNGVTVSLSYYPGMQLDAVTSSWVDANHPATIWTGNVYGPVGLTAATLGNSMVDTRAYDTRARISTDVITNGGTTSYQYTIGYNANSSIANSTDQVNGNWAYTYDNLDRLSTANASTGPFAGVGLLWGYDPFGNRKSQTATSGSARQPVYASTASTNQITGYCYDAAGNQLDAGVCPGQGVPHQYTYDGEGRITSPDSGNTLYQYDPEGRRVSKKNVSGSGTTYDSQSNVEFLYDAEGSMVAEMAPLASTKFNRGYVNAGGKNLAIYGNSATTFPVTDWLGTMRNQFAMSGTSNLNNSNLPFGDEQPCAPPTNDPCFTGKPRDKESPAVGITGLDDFGARYYTSDMGRFMSPDWSAKQEPVPYSKLDNPQSLNLYSYTLNNPLSNVDTDGHACSGILGNSSSGFCDRATEYGKIDGNATVRSQTRFFAAASAVSSALADVDAPGSNLIGGISGQTASFLEGVGQKLEAFNEGEAHLIASGNLSGPGLDQQLVHNEQTLVQGSLDSLKQSSPDAYNQTISQINGALNPGSNTLSGFASTRFPTDAAYAGVLDGVRKDLGRNIDFSKQGDREAIGNALVNHVRQTGGCDVTGSKGSGCH